MSRFTICILLFDKYLDLARRCLQSILQALPHSSGAVPEIRIGCNSCHEDLRKFAEDWLRDASKRFQLIGRLLVAEKNRFKYPMMRRLFYDEPLTTEFVMWFDDDSYFGAGVGASWWRSMIEAATQADMIGQHWLMEVQGEQLSWVKTQPWFNPDVVPIPPKRVRNNKPAFEFCQGAWWVIRSEILKKFDWPVREICHNGGDSMLGELCRHQKLRMGRFYGNMHINADQLGRHSKAKRRGESQNRVGWNYAGSPLDTSFQNFTCHSIRIDER